MMHHFANRMIAALTLAAGMALLFVGGESRAQGKSDDEVKTAISATKPDKAGKQTVTLTLTVNDGWHIYANPVGNEDLARSATVVKLGGKAKPKDFKVDYPKGVEQADKILGKYKVYEGKVEIPITVERAPGDTGPLELSVTFMACSKKGVCKLPATVKLTVP